MLIDYIRLFYTFLKLGFLGFGGGYAMLSMIVSEAQHFSVSPAQMADLNALDLVVPGSIAINAATYVGYLYRGLPGALVATAAVSLPSFVLVVVVMRFFARFRNNAWLADALSGVKPAAVGLIAAAALTIARDVLLPQGTAFDAVLANPSVSLYGAAIFVVVAVLSIRCKVDPIVLLVLAGVAGAFLL